MDLSEYEYTCIPYHMIPDKIQQQYNLQSLVEKTWCMLKYAIGCTIFPELVYWLTKKYLLIYIQPTSILPNTLLNFGLTKHIKKFSLVVDNFAIKYACKENTNFLINTQQRANY